ncbi:polysialyltransferase family glycosyltransferase [Paenibacillus eucommiae]|uniref:Uncharacterized protein n=1 Tax=Paenibacillus eucommiae TaxID=1355755 RepID=A0ABS4J298_9BACL|nr:polysialyltransferase family glycosyltransferase [Paenibacillus eucommiae]MBP1993968.1 hypothetical protein [Paenibacillus eucommiae]
MSEALSGKRLFVCTKPYQYMIARLIKQGCSFGDCDILILNHFFEAADFCQKARDAGVWNKVMFVDDVMLDDYKRKLNPVEKFFFYRSWKKLLPSMLSDISMYSEVFLAHDTVTVEYAIMRKFSGEGKEVTVYEEGYGNYINNSTHTSFFMKLLKRCSPWLGLPGGYIGSLRWVDSVWVQRPGLIVGNARNPLRLKAKQLPLYLRDFLLIPEIASELYTMYPVLAEMDAWVQGCDVISVVLTESWHDQIPDRHRYMHQVVDKVNESLGDWKSPIFFKQHPGERTSMERFSPQVSIIPKQLPFELLYLVMTKNHIRQLNLFSFGSTAILNLYDLCRNEDNLSIYLFGSMGKTEDYQILFPLFCELATKYQVQYKVV